MNKLILSFVGILVFSTHLFSATPALDVSQGDTRDLGKFSLKEKKSTAFTLVNRTAKPIVITTANVACGCTKVTYSKKPIPGGDSTTVSVLFSPKETGAFYKKIELHHTGEQTTTTLVVKGIVQ